MREASPFESIRHTHTGLLYICMKRGIIVESCLLIRSPVHPLSSSPLFFPLLFSRGRRGCERYRFNADFRRSPRFGIIGGRWIGIWLETSSGTKVCTILSRCMDGRKKSSVPKRLRLFILFSTKIRRYGGGILLVAAGWSRWDYYLSIYIYGFYKKENVSWNK